MEALNRAVSIAGGQHALARRFASLGVSITARAISKWVVGQKVPAERVIALEAITGVPREELRPDLYPPPLKGAPVEKTNTD